MKSDFNFNASLKVSMASCWRTTADFHGEWQHLNSEETDTGTWKNNQQMWLSRWFRPWTDESRFSRHIAVCTSMIKCNRGWCLAVKYLIAYIGLFTCQIITMCMLTSEYKKVSLQSIQQWWRSAKNKQPDGGSVRELLGLYTHDMKQVALKLHTESIFSPSCNDCVISVWSWQSVKQCHLLNHAILFLAQKTGLKTNKSSKNKWKVFQNARKN